MKRALLAPDYLTNYRYPLVFSFFKRLSTLGYAVKIVVPKRTINNLEFFCPDSSILKSVINSNPIFAFNKFTVFTTSLLPTFLKEKPSFVLLWGEINRIDTWLILFYKFFFCSDLEVVLWTHGLYGRENKVILFFRLLLVRLSSHCFLYDSYPLFIYLKHGFTSDKFSILGNIIPDIDLYTPQPNRISDNSLNLLFIGRLSGKKKIDLLISALESPQLNFPIKLVIVSPDILHPFITSVHNHTISYHTPLYAWEDLQSFFAKCDFTICPDNVGLFCIASLKAGRPIITHLNHPFHGPEASCLNQSNSIEVAYPVSESAIVLGLISAFTSLSNCNFFNPEAVCSSIPNHFSSPHHATSVINRYFSNRND